MTSTSDHLRSGGQEITVQVRTETLATADVDLVYDVLEPSDGSAGRPPLLLAGHPMDAGGFTTLASFFSDRTVVSYDPRGLGRSLRTDGREERTPQMHATDLHALIAALGMGPVDLFASSGGAVNALALVAEHPEDVQTLIAHEPPIAAVLPDAANALAACRAVRDTYRRKGWGHGMAQFIALSSRRGPVPADFATQPAPDPATFGLPTDDDGARDDLMLGSNIVTLTHYRPDVDALRAASTPIVVAVGADSDGELAHRGGEAVAALLGTTPVTFPGGHAGFLGGEYGQMGEPAAFARQLRAVLAKQA